MIGAAYKRLEDPRLLSGKAQFTDDLHLPSMLEMAVFRSPLAHARILSVDLTAVRALPGVHDAFSAADLDMALPEIPIRLAALDGFERYLQQPLAVDKVRYAGEPVAVIIADNRYIAEDALELIEAEFDPLDAVVELEAAQSGAPVIHDDAGTNTAADYHVARGDVDDAFARADYRRREVLRTQRHVPLPLETRGLIADYDAGAGRLRVWGATKVTYFNRRHLAEAFGLSETAIELIEVDVGGGFGVRGELYPEDYLVPIASKRAGRPVKWIEDRREHLMASNHSREIVCDLEIAAAADGKILALRGSVTADMGAYIRTNGGAVPTRAVQFLPGPYRIPAFACDVRVVMTNKTPVGTYRGPGRFEANFFRERLIDMMAADLGLDPAAVRQANLLTPDELPFSLGELVPGETGAAYDAGDYPAALQTVLDASDYDTWKTRQGEIDALGRRHGLGLACFVESSAAGPPETARIAVSADGGIEIRVGASAMGQGLETAMAQICADVLEIEPEGIVVRHGTTSLLPSGGGTFHSRNTVMAGNATRIAAENLRAGCIDLAALRWNTDPATLNFARGAVTRADGEAIGLTALAAFAASRDGAALAADGEYDNERRVSFSYGAHAAHVAVDIETGAVEVLRYVVAEEIGRALNPMMVEGQAVGGVVQGLGGALLDRIVYGDDGQLLSANLAEYLVPMSTDVGQIVPITLEDFPSAKNPMGFKGAGEGGIVAVGGAIANAVAQALSGTDAQPTALPVDPMSVLRLQEEAAERPASPSRIQS